MTGRCFIAISSISININELDWWVSVSVDPCNNRRIYIFPSLKIISKYLVSNTNIWNKHRTVYSHNSCLSWKAHIIWESIIVGQLNSGIPFLTGGDSRINTNLSSSKVQITTFGCCNKNCNKNAETQIFHYFLYYEYIVII